MAARNNKRKGYCRETTYKGKIYFMCIKMILNRESRTSRRMMPEAKTTKWRITYETKMASCSTCH